MRRLIWPRVIHLWLGSASTSPSASTTTLRFRLPRKREDCSDCTWSTRVKTGRHSADPLLRKYSR